MRYPDALQPYCSGAQSSPGKSLLFDADLFATQQLRRVLDSMQIQLLDHIVLGKSGETISMRQVMGWSEI